MTELVNLSTPAGIQLHVSGKTSARHGKALAGHCGRKVSGTRRSVGEIIEKSN